MPCLLSANSPKSHKTNAVLTTSLLESKEQNAELQPLLMWSGETPPSAAHYGSRCWIRSSRSFQNLAAYFTRSSVRFLKYFYHRCFCSVASLEAFTIRERKVCKGSAKRFAEAVMNAGFYYIPFPLRPPLDSPHSCPIPSSRGSTRVSLELCMYGPAAAI